MMLTNPDMMQGMLKQQLGGLVPQIGMGAFVSYFFSGFILGRVPFSLSPKFRVMLQRGIDLPSLDPSYFTSLSYYILLLFGLRGVFSLVFRADAIDDAAMMAQMQAASNPMAFDAEKAFAAERQALELVRRRRRGRERGIGRAGERGVILYKEERAELSESCWGAGRDALTAGNLLTASPTHPPTSVIDRRSSTGRGWTGASSGWRRR